MTDTNDQNILQKKPSYNFSHNSRALDESLNFSVRLNHWRLQDSCAENSIKLTVNDFFFSIDEESEMSSRLIRQSLELFK